ncbi:hypothetical protein J6590_051995 [Homalodisca vitripennis]|nr:hypothetical protein J6590_051995 [Homalodisca vitripennis]
MRTEARPWQRSGGRLTVHLCSPTASLGEDQKLSDSALATLWWPAHGSPLLPNRLTRYFTSIRGRSETFPTRPWQRSGGRLTVHLCSPTASLGTSSPTGEDQKLSEGLGNALVAGSRFTSAPQPPHSVLHVHKGKIRNFSDSALVTLWWPAHGSPRSPTASLGTSSIREDQKLSDSALATLWWRLTVHLCSPPHSVLQVPQGRSETFRRRQRSGGRLTVHLCSPTASLGTSREDQKLFRLGLGNALVAGSRFTSAPQPPHSVLHVHKGKIRNFSDSALVTLWWPAHGSPLLPNRLTRYFTSIRGRSETFRIGLQLALNLSTPACPGPQRG